jgi:transposase
MFRLSIALCVLSATAIKKTLRASEQERADVALARAVWQEWQSVCDPSRLIFLDETGAATDMLRLHGRSLVGERCHDTVPGGHWKTTTFIAGLRINGMIAPWCIDGAMDGTAFLTYVQNVLAPEIGPGDIVICDNLGSHKVDGIRAAIEKTGARLLYLPAYSPDLNPIETAFSKIKTLLRKAAERSVEALWRTIGRIINTISAQECANFFRKAGYVLN